MRPVELCAQSGLPANPACPRRLARALPRAQFVLRRCAVHAPGPAGRVIERWPALARRWDLANIAAEPPRDFAAVGAPASAGPTPATLLRIVNPAPNSEFILTGDPRGDVVALKSSRDDLAEQHWYLNDDYLGVSGPARPLLVPLAPGDHRLACMGPGGEIDRLQFKVTLPPGPAALP